MEVSMALATILGFIFKRLISKYFSCLFKVIKTKHADLGVERLTNVDQPIVFQ